MFFMEATQVPSDKPWDRAIVRSGDALGVVAIDVNQTIEGAELGKHAALTF